MLALRYMEDALLNKVLEKVIGIEERINQHMVTRDEFNRVIFDTKSEVMNHVDGFIKLHETLDHEVISLYSYI